MIRFADRFSFRQLYAINVVNRSWPIDSKFSLDRPRQLAQGGHMTLYPRSIMLERKEPELNMARFYSVDVDLDLFATVVARRCWGRIGTNGRTMLVPFSSMEAALRELARLEQTKRRRGYRQRQ